MSMSRPVIHILEEFLQNLRRTLGFAFDLFFLISNYTYLGRYGMGEKQKENTYLVIIRIAHPACEAIFGGAFLGEVSVVPWLALIIDGIMVVGDAVVGSCNCNVLDENRGIIPEAHTCELVSIFTLPFIGGEAGGGDECSRSASIDNYNEPRPPGSHNQDQSEKTRADYKQTAALRKLTLNHTTVGKEVKLFGTKPIPRSALTNP